MWLQSAGHPSAEIQLLSCHHRLWITPGNNWTICQNSGKGTICALNLFHILEVISHSWAVTTTTRMTPGNNWPICQNCGKGMLCGFNLLDIPQLRFNCWAVTTDSGSPQVITEPSAKIPAKARYVPWICFTFSRLSRTLELSPPRLAWPQVTTDPSAKIAAKACCVASICWTSLSWDSTVELSPQTLDRPRWQLIHLPKERQMHGVWTESIYVVARASALDLRLAQRQRAVTKH